MKKLYSFVGFIMWLLVTFILGISLVGIIIIVVVDATKWMSVGSDLAKGIIE